MILKYAKWSAACLLAGVLATGCTSKFEEYNTNPYGPTNKDMIGDNAATGSLIRSMTPALAQGQQNDAQMIDQMIGSEYGGCIANIGVWGNNGNFETYNPRIGWQGIPFTTMMPQIYTGLFKIRDLTEGKGVAYQWAQIIRIFASQRISDCYGPIPYSKITGSAFTVEYDDMETLYNAMFADLDAAILTIKTAVLAGEDMNSLKEYDLVFNGDFRKWVKFANTLKLRMAMRISNVAPDLARTKAEEAVSDIVGVMATASDAAFSSFNDGMNPYNRASAWNGGGEIRTSANITSYMSGYNDPRLEAYVLPSAENDQPLGVRNGMRLTAAGRSTYMQFSVMNIAETDKLLVMSASEAYFLRAEGALKGWNMNGTAKSLYEQGVTVAMEERGVAIGNYLSNTNTPADYTDPENSSNNHNKASSICPMYDESASKEKNLERILVQKWLANYPNGWETWADIRRTGYPKHFPIVNNLNTDGVTPQRGMRRIPFPESEYNTNNANVKAAISMLGGADNAATDLWWAKKN